MPRRSHALRLLECLVQADYRVFLLASSAARVVLKTEQQQDWPGSPGAVGVPLSPLWCQKGQIVACAESGSRRWPPARRPPNRWWSVPAPWAPSRRSPTAPRTTCWAGGGRGDQERGQLILVPRESPFSAIHLENMLKLARLGVTIMPAAPGFYHEPKSIEDLGTSWSPASSITWVSSSQELTSRQSPHNWRW